MTLYHALLLGLLQGVTEFLPISSSGHLALMEHSLGFTFEALTLQHFDIAIGIRPSWSDAHNNRSAALSRMGRVDEAIAAAERAVETGKNYAAMANLCAAYSAQGDNQKALAYGEQAVRLSNGTNAMALINYGVALRAPLKPEEPELASLADLP